jgi:hypothetical protein
MSAVATRGGVDGGPPCAVPVGTVSDLEESCRADG